ncbi:MAG: sulfurtransferase [Planctomycetes bacterium]|nr:sulfurtransferase [Planctomycetota bacterium]
MKCNPRNSLRLRRATSGWILLLLVLLVQTSAAEDKKSVVPEAYPRGEMLVEPRALATGGRNLVVLDARSEAAYRKGHVPGAVRVDHDTWKGAVKDGSDAEGWSRRIGALGIGPQTQVVIYDDAMSKDAARIWWILRYWGADKAALLNGGWRGWQTSQRPIELKAAAPTPEKFAAQAHTSTLTLKGQLLKDLKSKDHAPQIVDARSVGEFCGTDSKTAKRSGAMPGAKHLEWSDLLDRQTHRFKPAAQLRTLLADAGIDLKRRTVAHCQSGGRSSVMAFGLELMGADDVSNYYASWAEWGNADDTPIVKPPAKQ